MIIELERQINLLRFRFRGGVFMTGVVMIFEGTGLLRILTGVFGSEVIISAVSGGMIVGIGIEAEVEVGNTMRVPTGKKGSGHTVGGITGNCITGDVIGGNGNIGEAIIEFINEGNGTVEEIIGSAKGPVVGDIVVGVIEIEFIDMAFLLIASLSRFLFDL